MKNYTDRIKNVLKDILIWVVALILVMLFYPIMSFWFENMMR